MDNKHEEKNVNSQNSLYLTLFDFVRYMLLEMIAFLL